VPDEEKAEEEEARRELSEADEFGPVEARGWGGVDDVRGPEGKRKGASRSESLSDVGIGGSTGGGWVREAKSRW
jgi:hypothetical protein